MATTEMASSSSEDPAWKDAVLQKIRWRNALQADAFCEIIGTYLEITGKRGPGTQRKMSVGGGSEGGENSKSSIIDKSVEALQGRVTKLETDLGEDAQAADVVNTKVMIEDLETRCRAQSQALEAVRSTLKEREEELAALEKTAGDHETKCKQMEEENAKYFFVVFNFPHHCF